MVQKSLHFKTFIGESRIFFFIIISREMIGDITFFSDLAAMKGSGGILFANYFFFMLNKKKRNDLFMSVLLDDVRSFFFEYREYNDVTFKVRTIKMVFFLR